MGRPKRDPSAKDEMIKIAKDWSKFRQDNNLSQKLLAEVIGISRRTVQNIEAGIIIPQKRTIDAFNSLRAKYLAEGK